MAPLAFAGIPVWKLTGPWAVGFLWSHFFYGIFIVQVYIYFSNFPRDPIGMKLTVWLIFLIELLITIDVNIMSWKMFGNGWGDPDVLVVLDWSELASPALVVLVQLIVHAFYLWRIWKLSGKPWISAALLPVGILSACGALYYNAQIVRTPDLRIVADQTVSVTIWGAAGAACDILITTAITFLLWRARNQSQYGHTVGVINKLLAWTLETGLIPAVMALFNTIIFAVYPHYSYYIFVFMTIERVYANALMATLNSRIIIRAQKKTEYSFHESQPSTSWTQRSDPMGRKTLQPNVPITFAPSDQERSRIDDVEQDIKGVHVRMEVFQNEV